MHASAARGVDGCPASGANGSRCYDPGDPIRGAAPMPTRVDPSNTPGAPASPFTRLKPKLPARRGAGQLLNVPGGDPAAKRRTGMQLVDGHDASREIHRRVGALIGGPSARGQLDPRSHVAAWLTERNAVLREGPRGSGLRTDVGVT